MIEKTQQPNMSQFIEGQNPGWNAEWPYLLSQFISLSFEMQGSHRSTPEDTLVVVLWRAGDGFAHSGTFKI